MTPEQPDYEERRRRSARGEHRPLPFLRPFPESRLKRARSISTP